MSRDIGKARTEWEERLLMRGGWGHSGQATAAGVEQHAEAVVLEGTEPVATAPDLLDAQVRPFRWSAARAGVVLGEDLGPPLSQRVAERDDLGDPASDHLVDEHPGIGEIDVSVRTGTTLRGGHINSTDGPPRLNSASAPTTGGPLR